MIATTIEQGKRLMACGIKADTADMSHRITLRSEEFEKYAWETSRFVAIPYSELGDYIGKRKEPAWSLSALLTKILPKTLNKELGNDLKLECYSEDNSWCCAYCNTSHETWTSDPIEACVKMVEYLYAKKIL